MNSDQVFQAIEEIAQTKGTNAKQALLAKHAEDVGFERIVYLALDPYVTYGIASMPQEWLPTILDERNLVFNDELYSVLDNLASRELSGNEARSAVAARLGCLSDDSAELLRRILTKDLRAGFGATLCNKVKKGWIQAFDCMLAHPYDRKRVKRWPVAVEPKLDGFRMLAFVTPSTGEVRLCTRSGIEYTCFDHLRPYLLGLVREQRGRDAEPVVFDGEAVSGTFANTASSLRKKDVQATDAIYHVFDMLPFEALEGAKSEPYQVRRWLVDDLPEGGLVRKVPYLLAWVEDDITRHYEEFRAAGLEGVIVKDLEGTYELKRSYAWMKIKAEETLDLPVVDAFEGTGKYEGKLGGLTVLHKDVRVNVGSGFTDPQRAELWEEYELDLERRQECCDRGEDAVDTLLGRVVEVQYHEVTPDGSLRHPRFVRFRHDKTAV